VRRRQPVVMSNKCRRKYRPRNTNVVVSALRLRSTPDPATTPLYLAFTRIRHALSFSNTSTAKHGAPASPASQQEPGHRGGVTPRAEHHPSGSRHSVFRFASGAAVAPRGATGDEAARRRRFQQRNLVTESQHVEIPLASEVAVHPIVSGAWFPRKIRRQAAAMLSRQDTLAW